jgi:hypothetical protein
LALAVLGWVGCGGRCPEPAAAAVSTSSADAASVDLASRAEKLADEGCTCTTADCAEASTAALAALLRERLQPVTGDPATRMVAATTKILGCRDRLAYPSDPVDMDEGVGGSDDGAPASTTSTGGDSG